MQKLSPKFKIGLLLCLSLIFLFGSFFSYAKTLVAPGGVTTLGQFVNGLEMFLFWLAIPLIGLAIIIGAIIFFTSFGIPERIALGKNVLTYAGVGLIVVLFGVGLGQWLGEKPASGVAFFAPVSNETVSATNEYVTFLKNQAADYNSSAQQADAATAAAYKERAKEMLNIAQPLSLALNDSAKFSQEFSKAETKYQFLDKTVKELPAIKDKWQNSQDKQTLNNEIYQDYIVPLINYGVLSSNYNNPGASSSWINVLDDADLKDSLNKTYQERETARAKAEINKEYIIDPAGAAVKYGPYPPAAIVSKIRNFFFANIALADASPTPTASPSPTPIPVWNGTTAPVLGQTVKAQDVEFFWNGYNWALKSEADATKLKPMIVVKIKFADNIEKTYELKETVWQEKGTANLPPNAATWNLLEISCKSAPRTVNPAKKPCQTCKTYQEAANYFNQATLGIYHITPYSDFTGMDYNLIGPYEVERLVLFKAYLGEGEKAVQTLLTEINMLKDGKIFPTADWHFRILGFPPLAKMSTEERAKYDSYTTRGLPHKIWDEYGKALWLENKAWFEQTNVVYDPATNTEYTKVNDDMWAGDKGEGKAQDAYNQAQQGGGGGGGQQGQGGCRGDGCGAKQGGQETAAEQNEKAKATETSKLADAAAEKLKRGETLTPEELDLAVTENEINLRPLMQNAVILERKAYELITGRKAKKGESVSKYFDPSQVTGNDNGNAGDFVEMAVQGMKEPSSYYPFHGLNNLASLCSCHMCGYGNNLGECGGTLPAQKEDEGEIVEHPASPPCPCDSRQPDCCVECCACCDQCTCRCCQPPHPEALCPCDTSNYTADEETKKKIDDANQKINTAKQEIAGLQTNIDNARTKMNDIANNKITVANKEAAVKEQTGIINDNTTKIAEKETFMNQQQDSIAKALENSAKGGGIPVGSGSYVIDRKEATRAARRALKSSNELQYMLNEGEKCATDKNKELWDYASLAPYCSGMTKEGAASSSGFGPYSPREAVTTFYCCDVSQTKK